MSPEVACANCGRRFVGRWCPACGQETTDIRRPFSQIVADFLGDFVAFDARIWRTAAPLFTRPGLLTVEYLTGHRAPYVPPLRLYVFAGFLFFAVMAVTAGGPIRFVAVGPPGEGIVTFTPDSIPETVPKAGSKSGWFEERVERAVNDPEQFQAAVVRTLGYAHFLIVPLFALVLKLFWRRRYYAEHLVFSAHLHAFELLIGATIIVVYVAAGNPDSESAAAEAANGSWFLASAAYLFLAAHRVYEGRWWKAALRLVPLGFLYMLLGALVVGGVAFLSVLAF